MRGEIINEIKHFKNIKIQVHEINKYVLSKT